MLYNLLEQLRVFLTERGLYRYAMVLNEIEFRVLATAVLAFGLVVLLGRPVIRWLAAKKIGDAAKFDVAALDRALSSKANTPTMGGILIAGSILCSVLLLADLTNTYVHLAILTLVWLAVVGGFDDWLKLTAKQRGGSRQGLHAWEKLVFQLGLGAIVGYFAYRAYLPVDTSAPVLSHVLNLPFVKTFENSQAIGPVDGIITLSIGAYIVVMVLMMTGMSNAVNITDGMDGLASGITTAVSIGLVALTLVAGTDQFARTLLVPYVSNAQELAIVAAAVGGACLGFLWWNCSPAAVFMGDTGSLCLGGLLGYIATVIRQEYVLLIMSGVFLIEIGSVVMQVSYFKATKGKRIFRCAPYHWHLHMGGWPEQKIVARFWILTVILVCLGLASVKLR